MLQEGSTYPEYPVFKGLQKPLEFMGLQGRYINWAAIGVGGCLISFMVLYILIGFLVALIVSGIILGTAVGFIFVKQHLGLHSKKRYKGLFIMAHTFEFR